VNAPGNVVRLPHVLGTKCHWCSKERPQFRVHRLSSGQVICDYCLEWHVKAMEFLGGSVPAGCQECGRTWEQLRCEDPRALDVRIYVVPKDGILQMLCERCAAPYTAKRKDLYRDTEYGKYLETRS
jgi:acetone carboxylase gamma subunit